MIAVVVVVVSEYSDANDVGQTDLLAKVDQSHLEGNPIRLRNVSLVLL